MSCPSLANILLNRFGDAKLSDFGIVRSVFDLNEMVETFVGTMTYMSPERIGGKSYSSKVAEALYMPFDAALTCISL